MCVQVGACVDPMHYFVSLLAYPHLAGREDEEVAVLDVDLGSKPELVVLPEIVDRLTKTDEAKQPLADELLDRHLLGPFQRWVVCDVQILGNDEDLPLGLQVLPADLIRLVVEELPTR